MDPWKVRKLPQGGVNQAGVPMHEGTPWDDTRGHITRAVVLKTYFADDKEWDNRAWAKDNVRGVCCDVRTYGRKSTPLWRVPVLQRAHGVHDEDIYVPRDSNQDLAPTGKLVTLPSGPKGPKPTPAENLDGDHVLVAFLEGNPDAPVILPFCLPHPSSKRKLKQADGRCKRLRHAGVLIEWTEDGNLTIDASEAAKEKLGSSGAEQSNSGTGGKITIKTKDAAGASSSMVLDSSGGIKILDGGGDFLEFTKATTTAELSANFVNLTTGPRQPVFKATDLQLAESTFYSTGLTVPLIAALGLVGLAMNEIAKGSKSDGSPIWAPGTSGRQAIDNAGAPALAAAFSVPNAAALLKWAADALKAQSLKLKTG